MQPATVHPPRFKMVGQDLEIRWLDLALDRWTWGASGLLAGAFDNDRDA